MITSVFKLWNGWSYLAFLLIFHFGVTKTSNCFCHMHNRRIGNSQVHFPALKGAHAAAAASRCCLLCCCLHPSPLQCNGRTCCWPAFSRLCICSKKCNRCCLQCCCCLHCCYLSPSPLQCMLMLAVHPPLPLLSKVRLPPLLFALLLQLLLTPRAPAVQWPHGLLCTLFPPLSLL